ncbi:MAG: LuxR C-terminal-related transcriptional regulator, partial [Pseudomonadota bacterium]
RDVALDLGELVVAACDNIASMKPVMDDEGNIIAEDVWEHNDSGRWWEAENLALASPLTHGCRYESEPFWVSADGFHTRAPNDYLDRIDLKDFRDRALCVAAIVVPVHLPFGQIGAASFGCRDRERTDLSREFELYADELGLYARTFISSYAKVARTHHWVPGGCVLSKREVECLRWAALGKTDKEIGMILERSHATVRFHLNNASDKLNSVNRGQTIFKAAQLGYLGQAN